MGLCQAAPIFLGMEAMVFFTKEMGDLASASPLRWQKEMLRFELDSRGIRCLKKVLLDVGGDAPPGPTARPLMCPPMHTGDISFRELGHGTSSTADADNSCSRF